MAGRQINKMCLPAIILLMKKILLFLFSIFIFSTAQSDPSTMSLYQIDMKLQWKPQTRGREHKDLNDFLLVQRNNNEIQILFNNQSAGKEYAITSIKGKVFLTENIKDEGTTFVSIEDLPKGRYVLYIYSEDEIWYGYFTK